MMGGSGLMEALQILKKFGSGRPQDYGQFWGTRPPRYENMPKDIATQMARYFGANSR